jgi:hypothetical protein
VTQKTGKACAAGGQAESSVAAPFFHIGGQVFPGGVVRKNSAP